MTLMAKYLWVVFGIITPIATGQLSLNQSQSVVLPRSVASLVEARDQFIDGRKAPCYLHLWPF